MAFAVRVAQLTKTLLSICLVSQSERHFAVYAHFNFPLRILNKLHNVPPSSHVKIFIQLYFYLLLTVGNFTQSGGILPASVKPFCIFLSIVMSFVIPYGLLLNSACSIKQRLIPTFPIAAQQPEAHSISRCGVFSTFHNPIQPWQTSFITSSLSCWKHFFYCTKCRKLFTKVLHFSRFTQLLISQSHILIGRVESDFHFIAMLFWAIAKRTYVSFLAWFVSYWKHFKYFYCKASWHFTLRTPEGFIQ